VDYDLKNYKVRIIPRIKTTTTEENGSEKTAVYCRTSNPGEASIKAGFKKSRFYHLEVFSKGSTSRLGGDVKPFTIIVFANSEKLLFEALQEIESEDDHQILSSNLVKVLKDALPGLVRHRSCSPFYATRMTKDGVEEKLMQTERQPDGKFKEMPVILEKVSYFLFENELNSDADNIKYSNAVKRAMRNAVKATEGVEELVDESKVPDAEEEPTEEPD